MSKQENVWTGKGREFGRDLTERPRATAQAALNPERFPDKPMVQSGVQAVSADAQRNGIIAAVATGFISSGAVYLAHAMSPRFRTSLSISGKVALIMIPSSGAFFLNSLQTVHEAQKDPEGYMTRRDSGKALKAPAAHKQERLALWQSAANTIYTHPFKTIFSIFMPAYGFIFYKESTAE